MERKGIVNVRNVVSFPWSNDEWIEKMANDCMLDSDEEGLRILLECGQWYHSINSATVFLVCGKKKVLVISS